MKRFDDTSHHRNSPRALIWAVVMAAGVAVATLAVLVGMPGILAADAATTAGSDALPIVADKVLVNKTGGITVSGTMACAEAVDAYDWTALTGSDVPPGNLTILLNVNWTAYQPAGRHTMLQATFGSDHKDPCYNTNDDVQLFPAGPCGTADTEPCRWITSRFGSTSTPFYVYSPQGKFGPGAIHVDVWSAYDVYGGLDGFILIDGEQQYEADGATPMTINIFELAGFDLRASRTR